MSENLYKRFIDAFTDENESHVEKKRAPLVSDEQLEDTFHSLQKTIKKGVKNLQTTDKIEEVNEQKKSSRFQRWVIHYLKAPFQKWESKKTEIINSIDDKNKLQSKQEEEEDVQINSSSSLAATEEMDEEDDDLSESDDDDDDQDDDEEDENTNDDIENKLSSTKNDDKDEDDDDDDDDDDADADAEEDSSPIQQRLENTATNIKEELSSLVASDDEGSDDDDEEEEDENDDEPTIIDKIKEEVVKPIEKVKTITEAVADEFENKLHSSIDDDDEDEESGYDSDVEEEQSPKFADGIKDTLSEPIEKIKTVAANIKDKVVSSLDRGDETSIPVIDEIKESLSKPIEAAKEFGEQVISNVKDKLSSSINNEKEEEEEEDQPSLFNRVKDNILKPIESAATNLRDKLPSLTKKEEELSLIDRAEQVVTPIKDKIVSNVEDIKHKASDLLDSTEEVAAEVMEKSSKFFTKKTKEVKKNLPKPDRVISQIKDDVVKPLETKALKVKKELGKKTEQLKTTVVDKVKSLKKEKKAKTLTEKAKDKIKSISNSIQDKLPNSEKKKKELEEQAKLKRHNELKLQWKKKINGWFDEAWNIWHLTKTSLAHIFISSTKHARHLPRYNTTSLYTAYTDVKCYDYTKKFNRYRLGKRQYSHFLDTYRRHSPFPVYLSILKSNGPKCYRRYPDSSCGLISKVPTRNFKVQLYRFIRFWALIGIIGVILSVIYKYILTLKKPKLSVAFHRDNDYDRRTDAKQETGISSKNNLTKTTTTTTTTQKTSSDKQNNASASINTQPLDVDIAKQLHLWLQREQNDGYRHLSETCRLAINNTFLKQLERLSVETLQFANAKIRNVSQNNNNNRSAETTGEKIIINGVLDIDHLILNMVNTFKEQHFSLETQKLSGQLYILLVINSNQYSIEANLQQLQTQPVNIIDSNRVLSEIDKQNLVKLLDETISRTVVRCTFRLSDNQENTNPTNLSNSFTTSFSEKTKTSIPATQFSTPSIQTTTSRFPQTNLPKSQLTESIPTVLINDTHQPSYTNPSTINREPKKLLVRIVKAVELHDVEQPYCVLELNHPKQIQQTNIANNGLNPFWDERFLFDCDDKSNQIHLQIIDRKLSNKRTGSNYVDTIYADVLIPFSSVTTTICKEDIQINPQHPESIIRIEFLTLSEEEALAANNGYDVESLTDSQTWTYNDREANQIDHEYAHRFPQSSSNDYLTTSYDAGSLPKNYGLSSNLYDDERDYASTIPRSIGSHPGTNSFSPSTPLTPRDGNGLTGDKPQKSKSFMSSLKHLTLPRRKHNKNKYDTNIGSHTSSITHLNTSIQSPSTNLTSHSLSSEYFLSNTMDSTPIRRSRSISQSFRNLFRSSSKKKALAAKADALGDFENGSHHYIGDNRNHLSTSVPTSKKLSFLQRRKSKQKAKHQSTNSLSSYDCSRMESVRDTPIRANVGHPVTMTKSLVRS